MKNSLRQVKGKYDHGVQIHVHRLPFTVSVTLNLSMFMEVGLFLRDFDAGRKLTFGFKILSHIQGFRTINDDGEHLPRDYLSFVTGGWKKTNAPGEVMEVKKSLFFPTGLSIRGRPQKTFAGLFKKSSKSVRNRRSRIT